MQPLKNIMTEITATSKFYIFTEFERIYRYVFYISVSHTAHRTIHGTVLENAQAVIE